MSALKLKLALFLCICSCSLCHGHMIFTMNNLTLPTTHDRNVSIFNVSIGEYEKIHVDYNLIITAPTSGYV